VDAQIRRDTDELLVEDAIMDPSRGEAVRHDRLTALEGGHTRAGRRPAPASWLGYDSPP
jgi:hypothetical protein